MNTIERLTKLFPALVPKTAALMSWEEGYTWIARSIESADVDKLAEEFLKDDTK